MEYASTVLVTREQLQGVLHLGLLFADVALAERLKDCWLC